MRRLLATITLLFVFLMPAAALAVDQRCFTKTECEAVRASLGLSPAEAASGFVPAAGDAGIQKACGGAADAGKNEIGFCLPISQSETTVSFGGKTKFSDIGDFIRYIYRYGIWAAGIIAVVMIIVAGFQWAASGGNADMIGSAKKRIGGALTGLVLLALSYVVLNTINPYLVNLRLPQVWLINKQALVPASCKDVTGLKIEPLAPANEEVTDAKKDEILKKATFKLDPSLAHAKEVIDKDPKNAKYYDQVPRCPYQYLVDKGGGQVCRGYICELNETCAPYEINNYIKYKFLNEAKTDVAAKCVPSTNILVYLNVSGIFQKLFGQADSTLLGFFLDHVNAPSWLGTKDDGHSLIPVCTGGKLGDEVDADNYLSRTYLLPNGHTHYTYEDKYHGLNSITWSCPQGAAPIGVILRIEVDIKSSTDDWTLYVGKLPGSKRAIIGPWNKINYTQNYIPLEDIKYGGVFLEAELDDNVFSLLKQDEDSDPTEG